MRRKEDTAVRVDWAGEPPESDDKGRRGPEPGPRARAQQGGSPWARPISLRLHSSPCITLSAPRFTSLPAILPKCLERSFQSMNSHGPRVLPWSMDASHVSMMTPDLPVVLHQAHSPFCTSN